MVEILNRKLKGWAEFYQLVDFKAKVFSHIDRIDMPAMTMLFRTEWGKQFYARLSAAEKTPKLIIGAMMRKHNSCCVWHTQDR